MAVLAEAISVVVRADALLAAFQGGWEGFKVIVPNQTMCADGELVRVGFMTPDDAKGFVERLGALGLTYIDGGTARDLVVVDQMRGPMVACDWIEFGHVNPDNDPAKRVAACRLKGSIRSQVVMPPGWAFEGSLSQTFTFVPTEHAGRSLTFLRHEGGLDVYRNDVTGEEVFVGRTTGGSNEQ